MALGDGNARKAIKGIVESVPFGNGYLRRAAGRTEKIAWQGNEGTAVRGVASTRQVGDGRSKQTVWAVGYSVDWTGQVPQF